MLTLRSMLMFDVSIAGSKDGNIDAITTSFKTIHSFVLISCLPDF